VPVAKASEKHGVGSREPWVNGAKGRTGDGVAWHPNKAGMRAVAGMLIELVRKK